MIRKRSQAELGAIHAKTQGQKGQPSKAFLDKMNKGVKTPSMKVTDVKMFSNKPKPHTEVHFRDGKTIKVKETSDPYKAATNARMFKRNL